MRAVGAHFTTDINRVVKPGMASAGAEAEKTARGMSRSFSAVWTAFGAQSQGALGPVATVVNQIQTAVESIQKHSSLAAKGMVAGGIGAGFGIGLQALGSGELAAQQQLRMSVESLGKVYEDYDGQVRKTIKSGERHGHTAEDTLRVLNQLTIATKDPTKALADYSVVLDMAAVRHVPLQTAARMLSMVYAGNSRALKTFGIDLTHGTKALDAAKSATDAHTKAQEQLHTARQNLADTEARINASRQGHRATQEQLASATARVASAEAAVATARFKHGQASPQVTAAEARLTAAEDHLNKIREQGNGTTALSVSQQIELRKAHEAVDKAQRDVTQSATDMAAAHKQAAGAVTSADGAIKLLADRVRGQADPAMNTFSGHLHHYWAQAEDDLATFGNRWGGTVTAVSTGVLATSTLLEGGRAVFAHFANSGAAAASAVGTDMEAMASTTQMSMGRMVGAVTGVALAIGTTKVASATAGKGAQGAAASTLMGAVSGAVIGLSMGGPLGGAIGGAVGGLVGLGLHFHDAGQKADGLKTSVKQLGDALESSLAGDKLNVGEQTTGVINSFLTQHPDIAKTFAKYGVTMPNIASYLTSPGSATFGTGIGKLFGAARGGLDASGKSVRDKSAIQGSKALNDLLDLYHQELSTAQAIDLINNPPAPPATPRSPVRHSAAAPHAAAGTSSQLSSIHMTLLQIQHNTAKGAHNTHDLHSTIQRDGRVRFGRSPELATLG